MKKQKIGREWVKALAILVVFKWVSDSGTVGFTDELKRVPERYRATAERVEIEHGLEGYERFTPVR